MVFWGVVSFLMKNFNFGFFSFFFSSSFFFFSLLFFSVSFLNGFILKSWSNWNLIGYKWKERGPHFTAFPAGHPLVLIPIGNNSSFPYCFEASFSRDKSSHIYLHLSVDFVVDGFLRFIHTLSYPTVCLQCVLKWWLGLLEFSLARFTKARMRFSEGMKVFIISEAGPVAEAIILNFFFFTGGYLLYSSVLASAIYNSINQP